jgi:tetratricopeptide (TPR) repeat protein
MDRKSKFFNHFKINLADSNCNIHSTFWFGILAGAAGIIGYSISLGQENWKFLFVLSLIALASIMSGFFLGFLFGIPRKTDRPEETYHLSTNLVDISDWLTKIIIGLGLVEIKQIPNALQSIGIYIQQTTNAENSMKIFSVCCIIYFSIFGLYFGYNFMRIILSLTYKTADKTLNTEFIQTTEILQGKNLTPDRTKAKDESTKSTLNKFEQLLKINKTVEEYSFEDWYFLGVKAFEDKEYSNTILYMMKAIQRSDTSVNSSKAYLSIGTSYLLLSLYEKSIEFNYKAINENPNSNFIPMAYVNIGVSQKRLHREQDAIKSFEEALKIKPDYAIAYYNEACTYSLLEDKEKMIETLKMAVKLDSSFKDTASTDIDFNKYFNDIDFRNVIG